MALIIYLIALPLYPLFKYKYLKPENNFSQAQEKEAEKKDLGNMIIIDKIGVASPIIESKNSNYALSRGAWRVPEGSTPDQGGNTIITGHRFKYLPPNNLTFYLLDKLEKDDIIFIVWQGKNYQYKVKETKIVPPTDISILKPTNEPILTLYTCDPIYSQKNRLVVISELVNNN